MEKDAAAAQSGLIFQGVNIQHSSNLYGTLVSMLIHVDLSGTLSPLHPYLEGQGDLVSRSIAPITHAVNQLIPIINLVTKSP